MMLTSAGVLSAATLLAVVVSACGGSDPPPATNPSANPNQPGYYPPQGQQPYPQQTAYPQQQPQPYPQQQPQPTGAPPAAGGAMATPGPLALPCQADSACGLHRCNTQFQKCAFPCAGPPDCANGNQCTMGICTPAMGGR